MYTNAHTHAAKIYTKMYVTFTYYLVVMLDFYNVRRLFLYYYIRNHQSMMVTHYYRQQYWYAG